MLAHLHRRAVETDVSSRSRREVQLLHSLVDTVSQTPFLDHLLQSVQTVCQSPQRCGRPRRMQRSFHMWRYASITLRLWILRLPRGVGNRCSIVLNCSSVSCVATSPLVPSSSSHETPFTSSRRFARIRPVEFSPASGLSELLLLPIPHPATAARHTA